MLFGADTLLHIFLLLFGTLFRKQITVIAYRFEICLNQFFCQVLDRIAVLASIVKQSKVDSRPSDEVK